MRARGRPSIVVVVKGCRGGDVAVQARDARSNPGLVRRQPAAPVSLYNATTPAASRLPQRRAPAGGCWLGRGSGGRAGQPAAHPHRDDQQENHQRRNHRGPRLPASAPRARSAASRSRGRRRGARQGRSPAPGGRRGRRAAGLSAAGRRPAAAGRSWTGRSAPRPRSAQPKEKQRGRGRCGATVLLQREGAVRCNGAVCGGEAAGQGAVRCNQFWV